VAVATPIKAVSAAWDANPIARKTPPLIPTATARVSWPARQTTATRATTNGMKASNASAKATSLASSLPRCATL
jgi:hypothetical protein